MLWTAHKIALFPDPVKFGGFRLMPLTVGQFMLLEHLESPYIFGGVPLLGDFLTAIIICRFPFRFGKWMISRPRALIGMQSIAMFKLRRSGRTWKEQSPDFRRWIHDCTWCPDRFRDQTEEAPKPAGIPTSYRIIAALLGKFRKDEILDMSMPEANLHMLAQSANAGSKYETVDEYQEQGLPEDYAYHEEDWPSVTEMRKVIEEYESKRAAIIKEANAAILDNRKPPAIPPPINVRASMEKAVALDIQRSMTHEN